MSDTLSLFTTLPWFFILMAAVLGLMVGSFLNVVIHRLPVMMERDWRQEYEAYFKAEGDNSSAPEPAFNLLKPDSCCPKCGHKIRAWENIPLLSYAWLRGRCSGCGTSISIRYPLVELLTGVLSAVVAWQFGYGAEALCYIAVTWTLVALTFIDLDKMILPDSLTLPLLWGGLLFALMGGPVPLENAVIGAMAGYLSLWSLYWAFKLLTGKEGMGYGDFKLLAALGAWVGWAQLPAIILISSLVGAIIGISMILSARFKAGAQTAIPFGPYLAIAGWITLLYGDWLTAQYLAWALS